MNPLLIFLKFKMNSAIPLFKTYNVLKYLNVNYFRNVRSVAKPGTISKLVKGKVKTMTIYDDRPQMKNYQDLIDDIKQSNLGDELEVEKAFANEDTFGDPLERSEYFYHMHLREEKESKAKIKKQIIKNKYFKLDKETNLLTHSAKEQIRMLHKSNPQEWNGKALAECFPISEAGVKKLLKSNFSATNPEKIKVHDEEVAKRWKILKSGKFTNLITPLTQQLYKEGKLKDDYFSGNPNLPTKLHSSKKIIKIVEEKSIGEFSQIVQTYAEHEKQKLLTSNTKDCSEDQVTLRKNIINSKTSNENLIKNFKYASEELDDGTAEIFLRSKKLKAQYTDLPLSQFKEIIVEESGDKLAIESEYDKDISKENVKILDSDESKNYQDNTGIFVKISKYDKGTNIHAMYEQKETHKSIYKYDEQLGYQHPLGKTIKGNIYLAPKLHKRGKLFKREQCVYDKDGEFLYKVPT